MVKIIITGSAGEGVQWLGKRIADRVLKTDPKKQVSLVSEYQAGVRVGRSRVQLTIDDQPITCPFIDQEDVLIDLSQKRLIYGRKVIELRPKGRVNEEALKEFFGNKIWSKSLQKN